MTGYSIWGVIFLVIGFICAGLSVYSEIHRDLINRNTYLGCMALYFLLAACFFSRVLNNV